MQAVEQAHEPWFELDFLAGSIPSSLLHEWESARPGPDLKLPPANPFITADLELLPGAPTNMVKAGVEVPYLSSATAGGDQAGRLQEGAVIAPDRIMDAPGTLLFHKLVTSYGTPRAVALFKCGTSRLAFSVTEAAAHRHGGSLCRACVPSLLVCLREPQEARSPAPVAPGRHVC